MCDTFYQFWTKCLQILWMLMMRHGSASPRFRASVNVSHSQLATIASLCHCKLIIGFVHSWWPTWHLVDPWECIWEWVLTDAKLFVQEDRWHNFRGKFSHPSQTDCNLIQMGGAISECQMQQHLHLHNPESDPRIVMCCSKILGFIVYYASSRCSGCDKSDRLIWEYGTQSLHAYNKQDLEISIYETCQIGLIPSIIIHTCCGGSLFGQPRMPAPEVSTWMIIWDLNWDLKMKCRQLVWAPNNVVSKCIHVVGYLRSQLKC